MKTADFSDGSPTHRAIIDHLAGDPTLAGHRSADDLLAEAILRLPPMAGEAHQLITAARIQIEKVARDLDVGERKGWRCESYSHGEGVLRLVGLRLEEERRPDRRDE